MRTFVVLNEAAGTADLSLVQRIADALHADVTTSKDADHARNLARQARAAGRERIIAAGGDGTINDVLNGIAPDFADVTLGVIPLGTGNDFARALYAQPTLETALEVLAQGQSRPIDVGQVRYRTAPPHSATRTRYFLNFSAAGFTAAATRYTATELKALVGPLAFAASAARALPELVDYHAHLKIGDETLDMSIYNLMLSNGPSVGGGVPVAPYAQLDDGHFDLLVVPALGVTKAAALLPRILAGQHTDDADLLSRRVQHLEINIEPPAPFTADGEELGLCEHAEFSILPKALNVIQG